MLCRKIHINVYASKSYKYNKIQHLLMNRFLEAIKHWVKFTYDHLSYSQFYSNSDGDMCKILVKWFGITKSTFCSCNMVTSEMYALSPRAAPLHPWTLGIHFRQITCVPSDFGQANHSCPCYNHFLRLIALIPIWVRPLGSLYMHAWKDRLWLCSK